MGKRPEQCRFERSPFFWSRYDSLEPEVANEVEAGENWRQVIHDIVSVFDTFHLLHFPSGPTLMASLLFGSLHALLSPTELYTPISGTIMWALAEQEAVLPQVASLLTSRDLEGGGRGWTVCLNASATAHLVDMCRSGRLGRAEGELPPMVEGFWPVVLEVMKDFPACAEPFPNTLQMVCVWRRLPSALSTPSLKQGTFVLGVNAVSRKTLGEFGWCRLYDLAVPCPASHLRRFLPAALPCSVLRDDRTRQLARVLDACGFMSSAEVPEWGQCG